MDFMERTQTKDDSEKYGTASGVRRALAASLMETPAARGRRTDSRFDGPGGPVAQGRGAGADTAKVAVPRHSASRAPQSGQPAEARRVPRDKWRLLPLWGWWVGGSALILSLGSVFFFLLSQDPGFTLVVRGVPPGSDVYVDNKPLGIARADGSIGVASLESGKRVIRVSHPDFEDFNTSVAGKDGETKAVIYSAKSITPEAPGGGAEIDYGGAMILIKAGDFIMGDDSHEQNEKPAHKVTLSDYYIDKFEVTNARYRKFCDDTGRPYPTNPHWNNQYFDNNPDSPVVGVNWNDAAAYARWAGKRLPSEEEWEKAASWNPGPQQKRRWPWGNDPEPGRINLGSDNPDAVGGRPGGASSYGVQDMAGSVAEWVDSLYQPYPGNQGPDQNYDGKNRVVRGGHFRLDLNDVRTTARYYHGPEFESAEKKLRSWLTGFRCAVSADDPKLRESLRARASGK